MDAFTFLKERSRMCDTHRGKGDGCKGCPLDKEVDNVCSVWCFRNPEKVISIVEQWGAEHPVKTRQSEFLKLFPGANVSETDGGLTLNPCCIYETRGEECAGRKCCECRNEFWSAEVEDGSAD